MQVTDILDSARDALTVRRVFGEPIEKDGVTVIPAARVSGMIGGGGGEGEEGVGNGAGLGLRAKPAGAYVIRDGKVNWEPAIDVNRIVLGGQIVAVVALIIIGSILRARMKAGATNSDN